jgi:hypothetical protein
MAKKKAMFLEVETEGLYDKASMMEIALQVKSQGFVPAETLKANFGPEKFTRAIAVLYRDYRLFREVRRPWEGGENVLGYEWQTAGLSKAQAKKVPPQLGFLLELASPTMARYTDFQRVVLKCKFTLAALGGVPVKDTDGSPINSFERDEAGNLLILRYNLRAMLTRALPMLGKEQSLARHVRFETIKLMANGNLSKVERPVNDQGQGKGFCRSEKLADGTEFSIVAYVPTSQLSIGEYIQTMKLAGSTVGLSPGRSAGFGDYEVISADE